MSFRDSVRSTVDALFLRQLQGPFRHDAGSRWIAEAPSCQQLSDSRENPQRSTLLLYEDGRLLGPPHAKHDAIQMLGRGHYSHWNDEILFSASDNTAPNSNGRTYSYSISRWLHGRRSSLPVNYQVRNVDKDSIIRDVENALAAVEYARHITGDIGSLEEKTFLEVGPGCNYGRAVVFACLGAKAHVVDPYLAEWDGDYHQEFYDTLLNSLAKNDAVADLTPLRGLVEAHRFLDSSIVRYEAALEYLNAPSCYFDFVLSTSVIEHLYNPEAAFRELFRVTKPGGLGYHSVDFRDHLDFSQPLESLLMPDDEFEREFGFRHGECGNRLRPNELAEIIELAGFEISSFQPSQHVERDYVRHFVPRLQSAVGSRYRSLSQSELLVLVGDYRLRRPMR